ncbi:hypothetical protein L1049_012201 [Liquidambar formosana]|uniref:Uncharacterized protein n=1 Tax=Liquidambar formosana TaxID=63359 RepID=A0AAP0WXI6_LIQFO
MATGFIRMEEENERSHEAYIGEMSQMEVVKLQELKIDLETERKELEQRVKEVEKREAQNDLERKGLLVEKEKFKAQNHTRRIWNRSSGNFLVSRIQ